MVNDIITILSRLYPQHDLSPARCAEIVERAYSFADANYGVTSALAWVRDKGWEGIPLSSIENDVRAFQRAGFSMSNLARSRLNELSHNRLSVKRVSASLSANNPEFNLLIKLAGGMPVTVDDLFIPNGSHVWPKLSNVFKLVAPAVEAMIHDSHRSGLGFYLPSSLVRTYIPNAHLNRASQAMADKPQGRQITDCSAGSPPLNSDFVKSALLSH